jgi:hypothetical protein
MLFDLVRLQKSFITAQQLEEALDEQIANDLSNNHHKLIGEILLEQGKMTSKQIAIVLEELIKNKNLLSNAHDR